MASGLALLERQFVERILDPIFEDWFRTQVVGSENIPSSGPALIVSNHAGGFAIDALMVVRALERNTGRALHLLGAEFLFQDPLKEFSPT